VSGFAQRPTIADVAAGAGVSTVTVSRVIEGSPRVATSTRARVEAAMREVGYFGNAAATQLVSGQARTLGVVTSSTADYGYASTISGIEQRARQQDMAVLIAVIEGGEPQDVTKTVRTVASHALAGVIVIDYDTAAHAVLAELPGYLPAVGTTAPRGGRTAPRPFVSIDEYEGANLAAQHLVDLGHRSIFVLAQPNIDTQAQRTRAVLDVLDAARLPHYPVISCPDWRPESGYAAATDLLRSYGNQVTAIACANDEIALGATRAIHDAGLSVPEDISVVGFDDDPIAAYSQPALTTVRQDFVQLGQSAFNLLLRVIAGDDAESGTATMPVLVLRESSAPPNPARGLGLVGAALPS
jgi:DNA-binding LacI/PurR family transcriptional regulator